MIKEIHDFYELTKNKKIEGEILLVQRDVPVTFVHVFHKEYPRFPSIKLSECDSDMGLESLFKERKSTREFSEKPLNLEQLSKVLSSCRILERENEFERRTYPSAGARFSIEIYPLSFNVDGLKPGVYHYNILNNSLEFLWDQNLEKHIPDIVSPFISNPSSALIMTSVIARSEVKYQQRAYQYSLIEAGHIGQNISLVCAKYKIGCCAIGGFIEDVVAKILDLTSDEIVIYAFALGNLKENGEQPRKI